MTEEQELAKYLLSCTLESIQSENKIEGFAFTWLEEIIEISFLNGFEELMEAGLNLRASKDKFGNQLAGALTNIEIVNSDYTYEWPQDRSELEKKYSYQNVIDFLAIFSQSQEQHLFVKDIDKLNEALKLAKDDFDLETITCLLCVHNHFEEALKIIENELSYYKYRIWTVKEVMSIELFRLKEFHKAKKIMDEIYPETNHAWNNLIFAKGILGYQPWVGYPFSDY